MSTYIYVHGGHFFEKNKILSDLYRLALDDNEKIPEELHGQWDDKSSGGIKIVNNGIITFKIRKDSLSNITDTSFTNFILSDTVQLYKVIVGTAKRKTPIITSKLSYAVFNPTWTVPPTIIKEDIIPATLKNRGYLASKNITIYDSNDNEVSATDWKLSKAKGYR